MTDEKTIFRVVKDKDNPFVMIDRRPLENPTLSWKAKGLLGYLLSRPDNWQVIMGDLVKRSTDGEHATRAALKELMDAGHIKRTEERDEHKRFIRFTYEVHEKPLKSEEIKPFPDFQEMGQEPFGENPQVGNPHAENRSLNNTELNDIKNTEGGEKTPPPPPAEWGVGWQLGAGVKKVELPSEEQLAEARLKDAVGMFSPDYQELVRAFILATGIFPIKSDVSGWTKAFRDQKARTGLTPEAITVTVAKMNKDNLTITDPFSVVGMAGGAHVTGKDKKKLAVIAPLNTPFANAVDNYVPKPRQARTQATR